MMPAFIVLHLYNGAFDLQSPNERPSRILDSDKELALESIQRLPADAKLETIAERLEFLAAIRKGFDLIESGETAPHEEVKRQLASWLPGFVLTLQAANKTWKSPIFNSERRRPEKARLLKKSEHYSSMQKNRRGFILAVAVIVVVGSAIALFLESREPVYQGKPLSFWLRAYHIPSFSGATPTPSAPGEPSSGDADKAVQAMGTNAIPALLRRLQYNEPSWKASLRDDMARWIPSLRNQYQYGNEKNHQAMLAFSALGSNAAPCVPQLIALYDEHPDPFLRQYIPAVLASIGPAARQAVPILLRAVTLTNNAIRVNSVTALGKIHADEAAVVPALTNCLRDPYREVERNAIWALWEFGPKAEAAVPALLQVLRDEKYDPNAAPTRPGHGEAEMVTMDVPPRGFAPFYWGLASTLKDSAVIALWTIDPEAARKAGIKPPLIAPPGTFSSTN